MQIYVDIQTEGQEPITECIMGKRPLSVGRSTKANIRIQDERASGVHFEISIEKQLLFIKDLGSKNGVYLNGLKTESNYIFPNDIITFGNSSLSINTHKTQQETLRQLFESAKFKDGQRPKLMVEGQTGMTTMGNIKLNEETKVRHDFQQKKLLGDAKQRPKHIREIERVERNKERQTKKEHLAHILDKIIAFIVFVTSGLLVKIILGEPTMWTLLVPLITTLFFYHINLRVLDCSISERILKLCNKKDGT